MSALLNPMNQPVTGVGNVSHIRALPILQQEYALLKLGGNIYMVERYKNDRDRYDVIVPASPTTPIPLYKKDAANTLLKKRIVALGTGEKQGTVIEQWWTDTNTHTYDQIACSPKQLPDTVINLWVEPTVEPLNVDWPTIHDYLLNVVAAGRVSIYDYLLDYFAHALQRSDEKPEVMIVLIGGQGLGKSSLFKLIRGVWSANSFQTSRIADVVGDFNSALERSYFVLLDEAVYHGDKKVIESMKSLVTEPVLTIQAKHQPQRQIQSFHRIVATTNHTRFGSVDSDDRRYLPLVVSSVKKGNVNFWNQLNDAFTNDELKGFVHTLLKRDITKFHPRNRPETKELLKQKLLSLTGFAKVWYEVLSTGDIEPYTPWNDGDFVRTQKLQEIWSSSTRRESLFGDISQTALHDSIEKLCPSMKYCRKRLSGNQVRGYLLPKLDVARNEFEKAMGSEIEWFDSDNESGVNSLEEKGDASHEG